MRNSSHWLGLLIALPMLMVSLPGSATDYVTTFASVSEDAGLIYDATQNQAAAWSYTATNGVSGPSFSEGGMSGLSFTLPLSSVAQESLSMTSCRSFSGILQTIKVSCQYIDGLEIQAYYMAQGNEAMLGTLSYDQNAQAYTYSNLKTVDVLDESTIRLVFSVNVNYSSNYNSLQVYGLSGVTISVNEPVVPQTMGQTVTFDPSVFGTADLTNFQYNGILFTLNVSPDGDSFENENGEGVIYLATTRTDADVESLAENVEDNTYIPGSTSYAQEFIGGITLKVPAGSGFLQIEAETEGDYVLHVKVGNKTPVEIATKTRKVSEVPYNVDQDTYVYIYMTQKPIASRQKTRIGRRATAHGKIYSVKCASVSSATIGDADGSGSVDKNDVKAIADYIMGHNPAGFKKEYADLNDDGEVNVADLVLVIDMLLSK